MSRVFAAELEAIMAALEAKFGTRDYYFVEARWAGSRVHVSVSVLGFHGGL